MKELFENWRKLGEGEVIPFPGSEPVPEDPPEPAPTPEDEERVYAVETAIARLLGDLYGNQAEIPIDVLFRMEDLDAAIWVSFVK